MERKHIAWIAFIQLALAGCGGARRQTLDSADVETGPNITAATSAPDDSSPSQTDSGERTPRPPGAQAIRNLPWSAVTCTNDTALDRVSRLEFSPDRGWSCEVSNTIFADLTGDGIEEAIVSLDFHLTVVERLSNGSTSERRVNSREHVVIGLRAGDPILLVQITSDQGDITELEVVDQALRIELQGCWDCGCDIYHEFWVWDGRRFTTDEERTVQVYEAPPCDSP